MYCNRIIHKTEFILPILGLLAKTTKMLIPPLPRLFHSPHGIYPCHLCDSNLRLVRGSPVNPSTCITQKIQFSQFFSLYYITRHEKLNFPEESGPVVIHLIRFPVYDPTSISSRHADPSRSLAMPICIISD